MRRLGHSGRDKVVLLVGDAGLIALVSAVGRRLFAAGPVNGPRELLSMLVVVPVFVAAMYVFDLYSLSSINGLGTVVRAVVAALAAGCFCDVAFHFLGWPSGVYGSLELCVLVAPFGAYVWRKTYFHGTRTLRPAERIVVVGSVGDASVLSRAVRRMHGHYELVGMLSTQAGAPEAFHREVGEPYGRMDVPAGGPGSAVAVAALPAVAESASENEAESVPNLGPASSETLLDVVEACEADMVVVRSDTMTLELAETLTRLRFSGTRVYSLLDFCIYASEELPLEIVSEFWLCVADGFDLLQARLFRRVKRLTDIVLASVGLIVALPFMLLAAIAIRIESRGPVIFRQQRVGWMGRPFELLKFRSMRVGAERGGAQWAAQDDPRVTRVGRLLRKTHFDELPQMINILRGEMSFVGPRPERPEFVGMLKESINFYHLRHYVLPGITGWAQVNYPYGASQEDARRKLQYDLFYVCKASPLLDLRTLLRTARVVLFRQGSR